MQKRLHLSVVTAVVMWSAAPGGPWQGATAQSARRSAPADIEVLVKQALEDRLTAQGLPDGNLLGASTRIAIREEMPRAAMRLGPGALPQRAGYEFYLISRAAAQAESDRSRQRLHFITVDSPQFAGDVATISLGVDLVAPFEPSVVSLCCCTSQGQFQRTNGQWKFVKWAGMVCS
jgi:hypothetical protein